MRQLTQRELIIAKNVLRDMEMTNVRRDMAEGGYINPFYYIEDYTKKVYGVPVFECTGISDYVVKHLKDI